MRPCLGRVLHVASGAAVQEEAESTVVVLTERVVMKETFKMNANTKQGRATTRKQHPRSLRRRMTTWGIALAIFAALLLGCKLPFQPIPGVNRPGEYYYYTKNYRDPSLGFNLLGKCLTANDGKFSIIPSPLAIFPGLPLCFAENYVVCPIVDTIFIPYDFCRKLWNTRVCATDGVNVTVLDYWGRPAAGINVVFDGVAHAGGRVICDGKVMGPSGMYFTQTDASGKCYIPADLDSCYLKHLNAEAWTSEGHYIARDGILSRDLTIKLVPRKDWKYDGFVPENKDLPFSGIPQKCCFKEPTEENKSSPRSIRSMGAEVCLRYYDSKMPTRPADFDSYWNEELKRMSMEVTNAVEIVEAHELSTPTRRVYRLAVPSFGRTVWGYLSEPRNATGTVYRATIMFGDKGGNLPPDKLHFKPDEVMLWLSVFPPDYDYRRGDYAVMKRYGWEGLAIEEAYALDGLLEGRETYFFHPVILGAVKAVDWLSERPNVYSKSIRCVGEGQGGGLALCVMALNGKITDGAVFMPTIVGASLNEYEFPRVHRFFSFKDNKQDVAKRIMAYFDPANFAARIKVPVDVYVNLKQSSDFEQMDPCFITIKALRESADSRMIIDNTLDNETAWEVLIVGNRNGK